MAIDKLSVLDADYPEDAALIENCFFKNLLRSA